MPIALALHFDPATDDAVRAVWSTLAAAGESHDMVELGYPPHLTLMVAEDEAAVGPLAAALPQLAPLVPSALALGDVAQFAGTSVTWLSCAGGRAEIDRLHAAAVRCLPIEAVHPHYRAGAWTPHVTVAMSGVAERLLQVARAAWRPRQAALTTRLEIARFPPPVALAGIALPA